VREGYDDLKKELETTRSKLAEIEARLAQPPQ
jgi:hypothetical protein